MPEGRGIEDEPRVIESAHVLFSFRAVLSIKHRHHQCVFAGLKDIRDIKRKSVVTTLVLSDLFSVDQHGRFVIDGSKVQSKSLIVRQLRSVEFA